MEKPQIKSGDQLSFKSIIIWRTVQFLIWTIGVYIVYNLMFNPTLGIHLFWNILIPVAPLLLVVGVGIWRNVCPMASTALFSRHLGISKRKKLNIKQAGKLNLIAIIALFIIVPLRHAIFNLNGFVTAILILSLVAIAIVVSFFYEWKSAWCSGLCPIHPVEKLYGIKNKLSLPNAHCNECFKCVTPCPDSTPGIHPLSTTKTKYHKITGILTVGFFPGFVWGWFQVQDYAGITNIEQLIYIYKIPFLGAMATGITFIILQKIFSKKLLLEIFSASAVSIYYWYRVPALLGFGVFPGDGMLIDLSETLPEWSIQIVVCSLILFFFGWIVLSKQKKNNSWAIRPNYADSISRIQSKSL